MKHSVLICGRREPAMVLQAFGTLSVQGLFPDIFTTEARGIGSVAIRIDVQCQPSTWDALMSAWKSIDGVQHVVKTPFEASTFLADAARRIPPDG